VRRGKGVSLIKSDQCEERGGGCHSSRVISVRRGAGEEGCQSSILTSIGRGEGKVVCHSSSYTITDTSSQAPIIIIINEYY